jgi:DNA mismatch repair protein MutH
LSEIAQQHYVARPADPRRAKGWAGRLLEIALGATAGSRAEPDFPQLGVEMKTVPVDARGRPTESTYVCVAPLDPAALGTWETSWVRHKLARVLWIPIAAGPDGEKVVGSPVIWSPTPEDEATIRADWEEIAAKVALGELWALDGRVGQVLQVRPKAADGSELTWTMDDDGDWVRDTPRGFYLRPAFTGVIFARHLWLPE